MSVLPGAAGVDTGDSGVREEEEGGERSEGNGAEERERRKKKEKKRKEKEKMVPLILDLLLQPHRFLSLSLRKHP